MELLFVILLVGFIVGVVSGFGFTLCILKRKTIEAASKIKAFSIDSVAAAVVSLLFGAMISAAVLCFGPELTSPCYVLVAFVGAFWALISSVVTTAAGIHAPESLVDDGDEEESEEETKPGPNEVL